MRWISFTVALALGLAAVPALAQKFSDGTYVIPDSGYSIEVREQGDGLVVVEPNKTSEYRLAGGGAYHFYNPNTETTYGIRVIDDHTIEAFKPGRNSPPTRLTRLGGAPAETVAAPAAPTAGPHFAIAEKYKALALEQPRDAQTWAFCSAAALKRSMAATREEADAYGREAAASLSQILVDPDNRPCNDAIPPELWPATASSNADRTPTAAEQEQLARINGMMRDAAARQAAEMTALKEKRAADLAAYERATAEYQAGLEKSKAEAAAYARQQETHRAAAAEYARQLEEYRRKTGGK